MKALYFILVIFCFFSISNLFSQESKLQSGQTEALNFYPNPVNNGKIYIISKSAVAREITIYDVLGKKVFQSTTSAKDLNVSNLMPGIYIIKIKEEELTATRKMIVK